MDGPDVAPASTSALNPLPAEVTSMGCGPVKESVHIIMEAKKSLKSPEWANSLETQEFTTVVQVRGPCATECHQQMG